MGLADGHPRAFLARSILLGATEDVFDLDLFHAVLMDVRFAGFGVKVEAEFHGTILRD